MSSKYMPQLSALYQELSARQNVDFFARMYGLSRSAERREAVDRAIKWVDLTERQKEPPEGLPLIVLRPDIGTLKGRNGVAHVFLEQDIGYPIETKSSGIHGQQPCNRTKDTAASEKLCDSSP